MTGSDLAADDIVSIKDVERAREEIGDVAHRTPLDTSRTFAELSGATTVGLKLEAMQRTGSFKIRGAYNRMARLPPEARSNGVAASSAGNHAQGVALAGRLLDIETTIVVPTITPAAKIEATRATSTSAPTNGPSNSPRTAIGSSSTRSTTGRSSPARGRSDSNCWNSSRTSMSWSSPSAAA